MLLYAADVAVVGRDGVKERPRGVVFAKLQDAGMSFSCITFDSRLENEI